MIVMLLSAPAAADGWEARLGGMLQGHGEQVSVGIEGVVERFGDRLSYGCEIIGAFSRERDVEMTMPTESAYLVGPMGYAHAFGGDDTHTPQLVLGGVDVRIGFGRRF